MSTAVASVPVGYSASERQAINPWIVAVTVTLATFMELLDAAIANVALPHIAGGLAVSYDESTWVLTSYLVSNAAGCGLCRSKRVATFRCRFHLCLRTDGSKVPSE